MHTFESRRLRNSGIRIHHNGDFSGDAIVSRDASPKNIEVMVPCSLLLEFAAEFVRAKKIAELEQMDAAQLLGVDGLAL